MKVLVLGGGVVGVAAAWQLLKDGHEVGLIERHADAAEETSFANAGQISPGHAFAWSSPRAPWVLLRSLFRRDQGLRFRFSLDPALWAWSLRFLRECTAARFRRNTRTKHRLCAYSRDVLEEVVGETGVEFDRRRGGLLYVFRDEAAFERRRREMRILTDLGEPLVALTPAEAAKLEPALRYATQRIAGVIHGRRDESGDCSKFSKALARRCIEKGARIEFETEIEAIVREGDMIERVVTSRGERKADAYVLALGCDSARFAKALGFRLPIYPIKGYSVTLPIDGRNEAPDLGGIDERNLACFTRLGERLRITATAEFAGWSKAHRPADFRAMLAAVRDLLPDAADWSRPSYWAGLRPMTPDNAPYLGRGPQRNLWLNAGHGHLGWTMANGSARITADLISGREPAIDLDGLTLR